MAVVTPPILQDRVEKSNHQGKRVESVIFVDDASFLCSTFIRECADWGYLPEVKQQIADISINGSGIRDTARVLPISRTTVIKTFKEIIIGK